MKARLRKAFDRWRRNRTIHRLIREERQHLHESFPEIAELMASLPTVMDEYRDVHDEYTSSVSDPRNAISLETAALLALCVRKFPLRRIMDTGSGFSSYLLRRECENKQETEHWSIEDDTHWLRRTIGFLQAHSLSSDNLLLWDEFQLRAQLRNFDLIFHDMGSMRSRVASLPEIETRLSESGMLVLDDMHKPSFREAAHLQLQSRFKLQSLVGLTLDLHGRFAYIARRK